MPNNTTRLDTIWCRKLLQRRAIESDD